MPSKFTIYVDDSVQQQATAGTNNNQDKKQQNIANNENLTSEAQKLKQDAVVESRKSPPPRFIPEVSKDGRFFFEDWALYPISGGEFSFEEIKFKSWKRKVVLHNERKKAFDFQKENDSLKLRLENLEKQNSVIVQQNSLLMQELQEIQQQLLAIQQQQSNSQGFQEQNTISLPMKIAEHTAMPEAAQLENQTMAMDVDYASGNHRLSVVPQSLQNATCLEYTTDMSVYGMVNDAPTAVQNLWQATFNQTTAGDKYTTNLNKINTEFTVPIDQSQYIKDHVPTSTPASKQHRQISHDDDNNHRRVSLNNRRLSRPSLAGSPTSKLSPIEETSRECNSKSSSSSSGLSNTPGTLKKPLAPAKQHVERPIDNRPLNPNDPTTYNQLLRALSEPVDRRSGYIFMDGNLPLMKPGETLISAQRDDYLIDKVLSEEHGLYTANLISDDSNESSYDAPLKMFCLKVDKPANEWLFYICNELNRRLVKQKVIPDVELSVMNLNPALIYNDGSIMVDEFMRFVSIEKTFNACLAAKKPFPKSVAAYLILEMLQIVRQMHNCGIVHLNIQPKNLLITSYLSREEIASVSERTSIIKLIGFDRAMDLRLVPPGTKFTTPLDDMTCCEMMDGKPWSNEIDWYSTLNCIHNMFFLKDMSVSKQDDRWKVDQTFKGFPTECWTSLFDSLLNIEDNDLAMKSVDHAIEQLSSWIKANISFVVKESANLEMILDNHK